MPKWREQPDEDIVRGPRPKSTAKWCKGKEGREHVPEIVSYEHGHYTVGGHAGCGERSDYRMDYSMRISHGGPGRVARRATLPLPATRFWQCYHAQRCKNCHKILQTNYREVNFPCPDKPLPS